MPPGPAGPGGGRRRGSANPPVRSIDLAVPGDHNGDLVHRAQRGFGVGARSRCARCTRSTIARERVRERPWRVFCRPAFRDLATVGHNIGNRGGSSPVGRRYPAWFRDLPLTSRFSDVDSMRISSGRRLTFLPSSKVAALGQLPPFTKYANPSIIEPWRHTILLCSFLVFSHDCPCARLSS